MSSSSAVKFCDKLVELLSILRNRCASTPELVQAFGEAINAIEVLSLTDATSRQTMATFEQRALRYELVQALRERNVAAMCAQFAAIADETTGTDEHTMWKTFAAVDPAKLETDMPWKCVHALYELLHVDVSLKVPRRVFSFNLMFVEFYENCLVAFPSGAGVTSVADLEHLLFLSPNATAVSDEFGKGIADFFKSGFTDMLPAFKRIPFLRSLNVDDYWQVSCVDNPRNKQYIAETMQAMALTCLGAPMNLVDPNFLQTVRSEIEVMIRNHGGALTIFNSNGEPDMGAILGMAMEFIQKLESNGMMAELERQFATSGLDIDLPMITGLLENIQGLSPDMQLMLEAALPQGADPFGMDNK